MKPGDIICFSRTPPKTSFDSGIWHYEHGLLLRYDLSRNKVYVLSKDDEIVEADASWCAITGEHEFMDALVKRREEADEDEMGS